MIDQARPLSGTTILITRAKEQSAALRDPLAALGARVIVTPAIRFEDPPDWGPADAALSRASSYHWAIFTSANGVEAVDRRLALLGLSWGVFRGGRIVAIGPATAEALERRGLEVGVLPEVFQAEGILEALEVEPIAGKKILLARAEKAREVLPEELRRRAAEVDVVAVYRTVRCAPDPEALEVLSGAAAGPDVVVTFTSSSTVTNFLATLPHGARAGLARCVIAAIGPVTADEILRHGLTPAIQPETFTIPALVDAIRSHRESRRRQARGSQPLARE